MRLHCLFLAVLSLLFTVAAGPCGSGAQQPCTQMTNVVYVAAGASTAGADGKSWKTAFPTLQQGVDAAIALPKPDTGRVTVAVKQGTYNVDPATPKIEINIDRATPPTKGKFVDALVVLTNPHGVDILGGFAGGNACKEDRQAALYEKTVLSGEYQEGGKAQNALHVVKIKYTDGEVADLSIDGFQITKGRSPEIDKDVKDAFENAVGAGVLIIGAVQLGLSNLISRDNSASLGGSGLTLIDSSAAVKDSQFKNNQTAGVGGGAVCVSLTGKEFEVVFDNTSFTANQADDSGGAVILVGSKVKVTFQGSTNCVFSKNISGQDGAGIGAEDLGQMTISGCLFEENETTKGNGGAIHLKGKSKAKVLNSRFERNKAKQGPAAYLASGSELDLTQADKTQFKDNVGEGNDEGFNGVYNGGGTVIEPK